MPAKVAVVVVIFCKYNYLLSYIWDDVSKECGGRSHGIICNN